MALFFLSEYSVLFCMNVFFYESFREAGAQPVKIYRNVGIFCGTPVFCDRHVYESCLCGSVLEVCRESGA